MGRERLPGNSKDIHEQAVVKTVLSLLKGRSRDFLAGSAAMCEEEAKRRLRGREGGDLLQAGFPHAMYRVWEPSLCLPSQGDPRESPLQRGVGSSGGRSE